MGLPATLFIQIQIQALLCNMSDVRPKPYQRYGKEVEYLLISSRDWEVSGYNCEYDAITKDGKHVQVKIKNEEAGDSIRMGGANGCINLLEHSNSVLHVLDYKEDKSSNRLYITDETIFDISNLSSVFMSENIRNNIKKLLDLLRKFNGKKSPTMTPKIDTIFRKIIKRINEEMRIYSGKQDKLFTLTPSFEHVARKYKLYATFSSLNALHNNFPDRYYRTISSTDPEFDLANISISTILEQYHK